jgi:hypothetical protein
MATMLRENGLEQEAIRVQIASDDERYLRYGWAGVLVGGFLKWTIGYGHRPLLTIGWMLGVVTIGLDSSNDRQACGRNASNVAGDHALPKSDSNADLHPLLCSLDVFLPFVNLHQEHYWWPDTKARGLCVILGRAISVRGSVLRYYLWLQIISGWLLSAVFIAGVTGLIRND